MEEATTYATFPNRKRAGVNWHKNEGIDLSGKVPRKGSWVNSNMMCKEEIARSVDCYSKLIHPFKLSTG